MATLPEIPGLSGLLAVQHGLDMLESSVATKKKTTTENGTEREALKKEKEAHKMRLLEAKAKIFPQFVADYYDARGDKEATRRTKAICRNIYKELTSSKYTNHLNARFFHRFNELAIRETDAYLRQRFPQSTDLEHRSRLAKLLKAVAGDYQWIRLACKYRGINSHYPPVEEIIGWPGLVGFPDPQ
jgi:hypothetical protein